MKDEEIIVELRNRLKKAEEMNYTAFETILWQSEQIRYYERLERQRLEK